jgi:hypothetical protein
MHVLPADGVFNAETFWSDIRNICEQLSAFKVKVQPITGPDGPRGGVEI